MRPRSRGRRSFPGIGIAVGVALVALLAAAQPARAERVWRDALVRMSDGSAVPGRVTVVNDRLLIYNETQKRRIGVEVADVKRVDILVEKESMEKKWLFKEDGRDEKVYTGELFPVRYFRERIVFHEGNSLEGHVIGASLYLDAGDDRRRLNLLRKMEGKVGESLDDLVYVESIVFTGEGEGVLGRIRGRLSFPEPDPGGHAERAERVLAIHRTKDFAIAGKVARDGTFEIGPCVGGEYDLVVVTNDSLYLCFAGEGEDGAKQLPASTLGEIGTWAAKIRDFFHEQAPITGAGDEKRAYVLVRKERHGGTSLAGAELVRRVDIWLMTKPGEEWRIEKRFYVDRLVSRVKGMPRKRIVIDPRLAGIEVTAETPEPRLDLALKPTDEPLVAAERPQPSEAAETVASDDGGEMAASSARGDGAEAKSIGSAGVKDE